MERFTNPGIRGACGLVLLILALLGLLVPSLAFTRNEELIAALAGLGLLV